MYEVLNSLPNDSKIGLRIFGPDLKSQMEIANGINTNGDCYATSLLAPIQENNISNIKNKMSQYTRPFGETLIGYSLMQAIKNDFSYNSALKHIILITDGEDGCGQNPCAYIRQIMSSRNDIKIDVIAIASDENKYSRLRCLSIATNGEYYQVNNPSEIKVRLANVLVRPQKNKTTETPNLKFELISISVFPLNLGSISIETIEYLSSSL